MEEIKKDFLITLYEHIAEEVRFSKRQQMMATWYILLLYSAIVFTYERWAFLEDIRVLPSIVSFFLLLTGLFFLYSCQNSQNLNNKRVREVRKKFNLPDNMTGDQWDIISCPHKVTCLYYLYHKICSFGCKEFKLCDNINKGQCENHTDVVTSLYCLIHFLAFIVTLLIIIN